MRIGLLTDIHEAAGNLRAALAMLDCEHLDAIVQIGDAVDLPGPDRGTAEVVNMLTVAGVHGVWGNHDIGFCDDVSDDIRTRAGPEVMAYMALMRPRLELGGCLFAHVDPYLHPEVSPLEFYLHGARPVTPALAAPSFAAVPNRVMFIGHYHQWGVTSDVAPLVWDARTPLTLDPARRFLVVVGPLVSGHFGVYDTETCVLTPFRC